MKGKAITQKRLGLKWVRKVDGLVKSQKAPVFVIPAKAGIQEINPAAAGDSRFRGSDGFGDFLRIHQE